MEERHRIVNTRELLDAYRELLPQAGTLPLRISGISMMPFLVHERDVVYLAELREAPKVGDIILYQRDSGDYVLHRVCRARGETFDMIGDAQLEIEQGVRRDQMFAKVIWAERKGERQTPGSFWWEFFEKIWVRVIPLRPALWKVYGLLRKLRGGKGAR